MTTAPRETTPIVAATRRMPGEPSIPGAELRVAGDTRIPPERLPAFVEGAAIIVSMFSDRIDEAVLKAAGPSLKGVCNFAVGYDNIDLTTCAARNIVVTNTPDAVTEGTANMAWTLLLAVARRLLEGDRYARTGLWAKGGPLGMADFLGMDLTGKTLHVVGAGRIGYAVATRALAFGMRVMYTARSAHLNFELAPLAAERVELDAGLARADVVSLHTPLTPDTRHMIDARRLALMKPTAILINTARGPVVDEVALADALANGRLYGAGLDVFEREPEVHPALVPLENVVMAPHIGSAEIRFRALMTKMVCDNASAILAGREPPNRVR
ncbi:MAG: D-glycerate dehydrogenase [Phycisphaerales bacterium]|jgi:glyoxylate reductase|nr:D-glycerate dehydrogenase [Phycisphaerales bacterium]